jgi:hypothetical protein
MEPLERRTERARQFTRMIVTSAAVAADGGRTNTIEASEDSPADPAGTGMAASAPD